MYEEAASLASSILKRLSEPAGHDDFDSYDLLESAGMLLVQSFKQLGRTSEILIVFKQLFASIPAIPVQLHLTGVCFCISEGHYHGIREFLEVYLSGWNLVGGKYYVLVGKEDSASNSQSYDEHLILGVDKYLEVVEVYTVHFLGTILNDVDRSTSWVGNAKLPEDRRQVLLRRLHSLHLIKTTNSSEHNYEGLSPKGRPKAKYTLNRDTANKKADLSLSKRLEPCIWWFRTITLKFGDTRLVLSNGNIALGFLVLLISCFEEKTSYLEEDYSETSYVDEKCSSRLVAACIFIPGESFSCCSITAYYSKVRPVTYHSSETHSAVSNKSSGLCLGSDVPFVLGTINEKELHKAMYLIADDD